MCSTYAQICVFWDNNYMYLQRDLRTLKLWIVICSNDDAIHSSTELNLGDTLFIILIHGVIIFLFSSAVEQTYKSLETPIEANISK